MDENDWLAKRFEERRAHLRAVAYRMLGSASEAEDAIQETWLKLSRSDNREVQNLSGWLTTVIARILNRTPAATRQLASRARRRVRGAEPPAPDMARHRELAKSLRSTSSWSRGTSPS
jgi:hypothetical protein